MLAASFLRIVHEKDRDAIAIINAVNIIAFIFGFFFLFTEDKYKLFIPFSEINESVSAPHTSQNLYLSGN